MSKAESELQLVLSTGLDEDGNAYLSDFGIAKQEEAQAYKMQKKE